MTPGFFDDQKKSALYPFTLIASASTIRIGILTIAEKWALEHVHGNSKLEINARLLPTRNVLHLIEKYPDHVLVMGETILVQPATAHQTFEVDAEQIELLEHPWQIFQWNGREIQEDLRRLGINPIEKNPWHGVTISGDFPVYALPGANVEPGSFLLPMEGPIFLGEDSLIMAGSYLRGNVAVCDHAVVKMGAKIYAETTIGPHCKAGGEIQNSVLFEYSNKGHDGYLGNSVLGRWCNMGAGSDTSNLKNNYGTVRVFDYQSGGMIDSGLQFCGTMMGDHTKVAIGTTLNTGTILGPFVNCATAGFPDKHVEAFSWLTDGKMERFSFDKAMEMAHSMMKRRGVVMSETEKRAWKAAFDYVL